MFTSPSILGGSMSFIIGLVVGSFLNVVIRRGARGESLSGRSYCEACGHKLSTRELIPLISFLLQKGRCRSCGTAFSLQYPIIEMSTAVAFSIAGTSLLKIVSLKQIGLLVGLDMLIAASITIIASDFLFKTIPNGAVLIITVCAILSRIPAFAVAPTNHFVLDTIAAITTGMFFAALWFFSHGQWMGFGDAKLIAATSLLIGFPASLLACIFSFWAGAGVGLILLLGGFKKKRDHIPFGPYIILGTVAAYFWSVPFFTFIGLTPGFL